MYIRYKNIQTLQKKYCVLHLLNNMSTNTDKSRNMYYTEHTKLYYRIYGKRHPTARRTNMPLAEMLGEFQALCLIVRFKIGAI